MQPWFRRRLCGQPLRMPGRTLSPVERAVGWMVGMPFASWRYMSRETAIYRQDSGCPWPIKGFPGDDCRHPGETDTLQRPSSGYGAALRRRYGLQVARPLLSASELMSVVLNDPNVACPLEIARFERAPDTAPGRIQVGEEMRVRLPGPWNGPVRVVEVTECSFRLATLRGHLEAGEINFSARDDGDALVFEIVSYARSSSRVFDFLYDRLGIASELQLDMWAHFLERVAQIAGGVPADGIEVHTQRCVDHPF